jgi:hypothetical protein
VIQAQGSFAVGGSVITNPGEFDPYKPTPAGQTFHGDHAYVFLSNPCKTAQISVGDVAWHRSVFQNLGNHTRRSGRFSEYFFTKKISGLSD